MKRINFETMESIGSVGWLLMDFCWMCGFNDLCWYAALIPFLFLTTAIIAFNKESRSEHFVLISSYCWFLMNASWMMHDLTTNKDWLLVLAKVFFSIAALLLIVAFVFARKEKRKIDFRRMKIQ